MTVENFLALFEQYGLILLFIVFFLEHLNCPGFPAGVIMPACGVLVSQSNLSLLAAITITWAGSVLGSMVLYGVCYWGGAPLAKRFLNRFPKFKKIADKGSSHIEKNKGRGLFYCRLIPMLRTIISVPAGFARIHPLWFMGWSAAGILVWNSALISFGYAFSHLFIS